MATNTQLQHDVQEELECEPSVDATQIGVAARDGVITLTGTTRTYAQKMSAERVAKKVYGVKGVANDITVKVDGDLRKSDTDIAEAALNALKWDTTIPDDTVKVTVRNGWITLEGAVDWGYQREGAARVVRNMAGVAGVINNITVNAKPSTADIKDRIRSTFTRHAELDSRRVRVDVQKGTVKLQGNVRSWAEKKEAEEAAWAAAGVMEVENQLLVTP